MENQNNRPDFNPTADNTEQQLAWVCEFLQKETEKPDDRQDIQLIQECTDYLRDLLACAKPEEENGIAAKDTAAKAAPPAGAPAPKRRSGKRKRLRIAAIFVAALVAIFGVLTVAAKMEGYDNTIDFVWSCVRKLKPGESVTGQGITVSKPTGSTQYRTAEDFFKSEQLSVLYPAELPDGLEIRQIRVTDEGNGHTVYSFLFSDPSCTMVIFNYYNPGELPQNAEQVPVNGVTFHLLPLEDGIYHATARYQGYEYVLQCSGQETAIGLLTQLRFAPGDAP